MNDSVTAQKLTHPLWPQAHPNGRYIVNDLGAKAPAMRAMAHSDSDVQKHALGLVQRLMLGRDKLDFLHAPGGAATAQEA
jgi:V-ATPase subunit H